jgi:hypothetical protein
MNTNPTLSDLIQSAITTVTRVETILDRAEARDRALDALIEKFNAVFPDDHDGEADVRWAPISELPELPAKSIAASTPEIHVQPLPTVTGEGPAVDLAAPRKNPSGHDWFAVEDPTLRDLPLDPSWPELPPLPPGKTRWVNRGDFRNVPVDPVVSRREHVKYFDGSDWCNTTQFSGPFPHIQAVAEPVAEPAPEPVNTDAKPRMIPEVGAYYFQRNGKTARILDRIADGGFRGEVHIGGGYGWSAFYWHPDGTPYGKTSSDWDLVELCPF